MSLLIAVIGFAISCRGQKSHENETDFETSDNQYSIYDQFTPQKILFKFSIPRGYKAVIYSGAEGSNYSRSKVVMIYQESYHLDGLYLNLVFSKSPDVCYHIPETAKVHISEIKSINGINGYSKIFIHNERYFRQDYYPSEMLSISVDYAPLKLKSLTDSILNNVIINI